MDCLVSVGTCLVVCMVCKGSNYNCCGNELDNERVKTVIVQKLLYENALCLQQHLLLET